MKKRKKIIERKEEVEKERERHFGLYIQVLSVYFHIYEVENYFIYVYDVSAFALKRDIDIIFIASLSSIFSF